MTKINITISDQERSFSATVDSTVEDAIQADLELIEADLKALLKLIEDYKAANAM